MGHIKWQCLLLLYWMCICCNAWEMQQAPFLWAVKETAQSAEWPWLRRAWWTSWKSWRTYWSGGEEHIISSGDYTVGKGVPALNVYWARSRYIATRNLIRSFNQVDYSHSVTDYILTYINVAVSQVISLPRFLFQGQGILFRKWETVAFIPR